MHRFYPYKINLRIIIFHSIRFYAIFPLFCNHSLVLSSIFNSVFNYFVSLIVVRNRVFLSKMASVKSVNNGRLWRKPRVPNDCYCFHFTAHVVSRTARDLKTI